MLISFEWLSDFLDLSTITAEELADRMSRTGIEIESVYNYGVNLNNLVVGEVVELEAMEDSKHLSITQVDVGQEELVQIVCGAPNVKKGQKVIVALPGAVLPGNFKIKKSKLRGHTSNGMICSLQELGFSDSVVAKEYAKGIFPLPQDAKVGTDIVEYLKLDDSIIELDITPNRADALSIYGTAHEVGAILSQVPEFKVDTRSYNYDSDTSLLDQVKIDIENEKLSECYQLRLIKDITVAESPLWLQIRLMKSGIRPVNNIVDTTNYFLLLYGQPMHAFDFDKLNSKVIKVKSANDGEQFTTLDGVTRTLSSTDIVIASDDTPIALAGVMGGLDSEVSTDTRNVLLETAIFNPERVGLTSKKFGLRSESSARFEKGINKSIITESAEGASQLMATLGNGQVVKGNKESSSLKLEDVKVRVKNSSLLDKVGIDLTNEEIAEIIDRLGFTIEFEEDSYVVSVPSRRWDISIEADILEEIARIYGYDNIPTNLPAIASRPGRLNNKQQWIRQTRVIAEGLGLNQVITYILTSEKMANLIKSDESEFIKLNFPMSEDRKYLRQSMFPALLETAQYNQARQNNHLGFYETGKVFYAQGEHQQPIEKEKFAILVSGEYQQSTWYGSSKNYDFYVLKGMLETYFEGFRLTDVISYESMSSIDVLHPTRTARILLDGQPIGYMGQIHPTITEEFDLSQDSYFAEIDIEMMLSYQRESLIQQAIPKYPSSSRDIALLVNKDQQHQELVDIIKQNGGEYLLTVSLFDRYVGDNIPEDKQSLAYHLVFRNPVNTLKDEDVEEAMNQIIRSLENFDGLEIR
ncbi:phenylalanine--tRNA ligase subunit beta [Aerococcaceae bacterium WGS1372]